MSEDDARRKLFSDVVFQKTFVMIKPDAIREKRIIGKIITRFEDAGLSISNLKIVMPSSAQLEKHYSHLSPEILTQICKYIHVPVIIMVLWGSNSVEKVKKMVGATEPLKADMGTIRGDFESESFESAKASYSFTNMDTAIRNLIHASDSVENAKREIEIWFDGVDHV